MNKPKKAKGPIRVEAIVPLLIVLALAVAYFTLFFDGHLRRGLEWAGSQANGAEVNIGDLDLSFLKARLTITDIQVTDRGEPAKNKAQIGNVSFDLLWDALLRAKVVVSDAAITGIETGTARKRPGYVLPAAKEGSVTAQAIDRLKSELGQTSLGDLARFLEGFDPSAGIGNLGELKSAARIEQLKGELSQKEKQWSDSLNKIPGQKDFADLQAKLTAATSGGTSNPAEIAGKVNAVNGLIKESEGKLASVTQLGDSLVGDVNGFGKAVGEVDDLAAQDRKGIESKLKIPSIEPKQLAMQLFGNKVLDQVGQVQRYIDTARSYIPPKKKDEKQAEPARTRAEGRSYEFGRPNSYPKFWLRRAKISSTGEHSAFAGDVQGTLEDASFNPPQTGKPTVLTLKGEFPKQQIGGVVFRGVMDHVTSVPKESFSASVASFPVAQYQLSESESLKFGFNKARGSAKLDGSMQGDQITLAAASTFREVDYLVTAQSKILESTLRAVVKGIPAVEMGARIKGSWSDFDLSIESNLATALGRGLQAQLQAKLAEARKKIDALIQGKISAGKAELTGRMNEARSKVTAQVEDRKKQALAFKSQADAKLKELKSRIPTPGGKATEQLKKKLPF
jgi:uncharacterized protein (TIGR03545 family)